MKENVLDVLMYLFEHFLDDEIEMEEDQDTLKGMLREAGFPNGEINKAFQWLEDLAELQDQPSAGGLAASRAIRVYTGEEQQRLDTECRGFLLFLEQAGVLDATARELVIDRLMALDAREISLDQVKWVVLMVLFNQPGQESAAAWMEELVYEDATGHIH